MLSSLITLLKRMSAFEDNFAAESSTHGQDEVDAAVASLVEQGLDVDVVEQERQGEASGAQEPEINTAVLAERVRHYLKANQIQWTRFASLVLGVSQGRLSILLGKPKPWQQLAPRVRALYERMLLWMDTKATFGNNPYMKVKKEKPIVKREKKIPAVKRVKRKKSLFDRLGSSSPVPFAEKVCERVFEEQGAVGELIPIEQQVLIEEQAVHEVVVEEPVEQVVIENINLEQVVVGNMLNLEGACIQGQSVSVMVAEVDRDQPDTYTLSLI